MALCRRGQLISGKPEPTDLICAMLAIAVGINCLPAVLLFVPAQPSGLQVGWATRSSDFLSSSLQAALFRLPLFSGSISCALCTFQTQLTLATKRPGWACSSKRRTSITISPSFSCKDNPTYAMLHTIKHFQDSQLICANGPSTAHPPFLERKYSVVLPLRPDRSTRSATGLVHLHKWPHTLPSFCQSSTPLCKDVHFLQRSFLPFLFYHL